METFQMVQNIRSTVQSLNECREFIVNKEKRLEIDKLISELTMNEELLLAKNPLLLSGLGPISTVPKIGSANMQQFRVFIDQHTGPLSQLNIEQEAVYRGLNAQSALSSVTTMKQQEFEIRSQALANHFLPFIRDKVYGKEVTESSLLRFIQQFVNNNMQIEPQYKQRVSILIFEQLKFESNIP